MNGRSFQTLIQLTPGVVAIPSSANDGGQFSVNGQRGESNYWTVDGVSANVGVSSGGLVGNGFAGALGSFSVLGGTNSLVSVDALQEFRIQTSTYAPEFGRTSGGQISIVTRSGTNRVHGTAFDYLRNDVLDANDWFADSKGLPKPRERQNDFGGIAKYDTDAAYQIAQVYAYRGESDKSFEWLERAYKQRDAGLADIKTDPLFKNLRHDPRHAEFLRKMRPPK